MPPRHLTPRENCGSIVPDPGKDGVDDSFDGTRQRWRNGREEMFMGVDTGRRWETRITCGKIKEYGSQAGLLGSGQA